MLADAVDAADDGLEDDEPRRVRGCPPGYLVPEAEIVDLYRRAGRGYRLEARCPATRP